MFELLQSSDYAVACCDGAEGMLRLPDKSIKLIYGSPPYPNAERDYGVWKSSEYIDKMTPFLNAAVLKLRDDGFIVINVKANREKSTSKASSKRSLVVEKLAILMEEEWGLSCVDIEIWVKENPVPTGLRVACQDAYEQNLWFSKSPKWTINLDAIRRPYESHSIKTYEEYEYKPRSNGLTYVRKNKRIKPHPIGALPRNVISGGVSAKIGEHQATQPIYLPDKYIKATTEEGDLVVDPWMGSGTTGFAALSLKRKFIGFDIVDSYVKTAENCFKEFIQGMVIGNEQKSSQT
jgi:DNA modification methylase